MSDKSMVKGVRMKQIIKEGWRKMKILNLIFNKSVK